MAAGCRQEETVGLLLSREFGCAPPPDSADNDDQTPLALAAARNRGSRANSRDVPGTGESCL